MRFTFCSTLPNSYRDDLESLMFFNPLQHAAADGVADAVEAFGAPEIVESGDLLSVNLPGRQVQALFALADSPDGCELAGLVVYVRVDAGNVIILHVAVTERFCAAGEHAAAMLVMRLVGEVARCARRLGGVRSVTLLYCRREVVLHLGPQPGPAAEHALRAVGVAVRRR